MKLYSTIVSERASKGQGGNSDILVVLTAEISGERQQVASMSIVNSKAHDFYGFQYTLPDGKKGLIKISKGKKCVSMAHDDDIKEHGHCLECQRSK